MVGLPLEEQEEVWVDFLYDVIDFGNSIHSMADYYEIGVQFKKKKPQTPEQYVDDVLKNLFNKGDNDEG